MNEAAANDWPEGPALLGSPEASAFRAYCAAVKREYLSDEESDVLGGQIYAGRLAAQRLKDPSYVPDIEEYFLFEQTVERGQEARRIMASKHLGLVIGLSRRFSRNPEERIEMIGVGNVALMSCMDGYVHEPGRPFAPFAKTCILNALCTEVVRLTRSSTGLSRYMQTDLLEIERAYEEAQQTDASITFLEVAARLGFDESRVEEIVRLRRHTTASIDAAMNDSNRPVTIADTLADVRAEGALDDALTSAMAAQAWSAAKVLRRREVLTVNEYAVLVGRYREVQTQRAVADALGTTVTVVFDLEKMALAKLRKYLEDPESINKSVDPTVRIVKTPIDLLEILNIPYDDGTNIIDTACEILDRADLTSKQRETMHALLGTKGNRGIPQNPQKVAKAQGVIHQAVNNARKQAVRRLLIGYGIITP